MAANPKMLELKALLLTAIEEHPELSEEERGNLLGECDLILSFSATTTSAP